MTTNGNSVEFTDSGCDQTPNKPATSKASIQANNSMSEKLSAASLLQHPSYQKKPTGKQHSMPSLLKSPVPPPPTSGNRQNSNAPPPNLSPSPLFSESSSKTITSANPGQVIFPSDGGSKHPIGPIGDHQIHPVTAPGAIGRPSHPPFRNHQQNAMNMIFGRGLNEEDGSDFYEDEKKAFFLGGLHRDMQREDIYNELQKYGLYIRKLDCPYNDKSTKSGNKGYAFVHVKDEGMALKILSLEKLKILNETCSVKPYKRDPNNRKKGGGMGGGHDRGGMNYPNMGPGGNPYNKSKSFDPTRMDFTHITNQQNMQNNPHLLAMFWQARFEELYKAHVMLLQGHFMNGSANGGNMTHNMPPFPSPWAPASLMNDYENMTGGGPGGPGAHMHPPHGGGPHPPFGAHGPFGTKHNFNVQATSFFPSGMPNYEQGPPHSGPAGRGYRKPQDDRLNSILGGNSMDLGYPIKPKPSMSKNGAKSIAIKASFLEDTEPEEVGIGSFNKDCARLESNSSEKLPKSVGGLRIEAPNTGTSTPKAKPLAATISSLSKSLGSPQPGDGATANGNIAAVNGAATNGALSSASTHGSSLGHSPLAGGRGKRESQSLSISESLGKQAAQAVQMASSPGKGHIGEKADELSMLANGDSVKTMTPVSAFKKQSSIFDDKQLTLPSDESQRFFSTSRTTSSSSDKN